MKIDGACHCGQITFEADVDPQRVTICHCTDCQTLSGSPYRTVVPAAGDSFRLLTGTLKTYVKIAASGARRAQVFCPECGTPIYAGPADGSPGFMGIRLGAVRQRDGLRPSRQIWCESAQDWVGDLSAIPRTEGQ